MRKRKNIYRKTNATFVYFDYNVFAKQLIRTRKTSPIYPITKLSLTEEFVLLHRLNFYLPPTNPKREGIFEEFEVLIAQLQHHRSQSPEKHFAFEAKLSDLAHACCSTPTDVGNFLMNRECFRAIKPLRSNSNNLNTRPDKVSGVVVLNKTDYIAK